VHGASIFGDAKLIAQPCRPALSAPKEYGDAGNQNDDERNDYGDFRCA
jgi:hypothetical protein